MEDVGAPLELLGRAVVTNPAALENVRLLGEAQCHLGELLAEAGLESVQETTLEASVEFSSFEEWWEPFTLGVGPAGAYAKTLDDRARTRLRDRCRQLVTRPPFTVKTTAWTARGLV